MTTKARRPAPEVLAGLPVAVDAMGGDKAPAEIVAGARRAADDEGIPIVLVGPPGPGGRHRGPRARGLHRGHRHARGPGPRGAAQEGLVARAGGRARARRQGLGHGQRRQHRGHHGLGPVADGSAPGGLASVHRHPAAPPGLGPGRPGRRRRQRRVHPGHAGPVRPDGVGLRRRPLRHRRADGGPVVDRRGADQGQPAGQRGPRPAGRRRHRCALHRQRRGPGPAARARPTWW